MPKNEPSYHLDGAQAQILGDYKTVLLDTVKPNPWNYNTQDKATFTKLVESVRRNGFVQPPIVRTLNGGYEIINGEHRFHAAQSLGMTKMPVIDLGTVDDLKAKQLSIILNELSGNPDQVRLAELLRDIHTQVPMSDLTTVMPYTERELTMLTEAVDFSFDHLSTGDTRSPAAVDAVVARVQGGAPAPAPATPTAPTPTPTAKTIACPPFIFELSVADQARVVQLLEQIDDDRNVALMALVEMHAQETTDGDEVKG